MNLGQVLVWGGAATVALTVILETAMYLGVTRMSLPYILGTVVTSDRRKAAFYGAGLHLLNGLGFAFVYAAAFEALGRSGWWVGGLIGIAHSLAILTLIPSIAGVHPRMASPRDGPEARTALQPPGFFALNYGIGTPLTALAAHIIYGVILGAFYSVT